MRPCRSLLRGARGPPASRPAPPGPCTRPGLPACLRAALLAHERAAACPGRRKPQHFHAPQHHTGPVALNRPRQGSEQRKRSASRRCRGSGARQPGAAAERGSPARSEPHRVGAAGQAQRLGEREEDAAGARGDRRDRRRQQRLRKHERVGQAERRLAERADDAVRDPAAQARLDEAARQPERDRDQPPAPARAAPLSPAPLPPGFASGCGAGRGAAARAVPVELEPAWQHEKDRSLVNLPPHSRVGPVPARQIRPALQTRRGAPAPARRDRDHDGRDAKRRAGGPCTAAPLHGARPGATPEVTACTHKRVARRVRRRSVDRLALALGSA